MSSGEHLVDDGVQFASALEVVAERLLDDDSSPLTVLGLREARRRQLLEHLRKRVGRNRKVETVIAADTTFVVERCQRVGQVLEASASSKLPSTNRIPSASLSQTS